MSESIEIDKELIERELDLQKRSAEIEEKAMLAMKLMEESLNVTKEQLSTEEISSLAPNEEEEKMELMMEAMGEMKDHILSNDDSDKSSTKTQAKNATNSAIKLLQTKLRSTSDQLRAAIERARKAENEMSNNSVKMKALMEENAKLTKQNQSLLVSLDKNKIAITDAQTSKQDLQSRIHSLEKELDNATKSLKTSMSSRTSIELKLNRALDELQKSREQLLRASMNSMNGTSSSNIGSSVSLKDGNSSGDIKSSQASLSDIMKLREELKHADKQKHNLSLMIKKQAQLIDVLKRQKIHLEAAKALELTEEDFVKCLDMK